MKRYLIIIIILSFVITLNVEAKNICKTATQLHTDTCKNTFNKGCSDAGYKPDELITFGNLGTKGDFQKGNAYDCDVNGDGIYDPNSERFYYVTDLEENPDYAVLIYYNNVSNGLPNNTSIFAYLSSGNLSTDGPDTAKLQLPTTKQWKNVKLANEKRDIKDDNKNVIIEKYSYEGYAARFLTYQEVYSVCGKYHLAIGFLEPCKYMMENTVYVNDTYAYGFWLENIRYNRSDSAWLAFGDNRLIYPNFKNNTSIKAGVRPVIEVLKSEIDNEEVEEDQTKEPEESNNKNNESSKTKENSKKTTKNPNTSTFIVTTGILFLLSALSCIILKYIKVNR